MGKHLIQARDPTREAEIVDRLVQPVSQQACARQGAVPQQNAEFVAAEAS
jgi:hypothetical protein